MKGASDIPFSGSSLLELLGFIGSIGLDILGVRSHDTDNWEVTIDNVTPIDHHPDEEQSSVLQLQPEPWQDILDAT